MANRKSSEQKTKKRSYYFKETLELFKIRARYTESQDRKKTTFLELFFDLGVVFVFALLAKNFSLFIGISPFEFEKSMLFEEPSISVVGMIFWLANFLALWLIWYRYGSWFRKYGTDNFLAYILTLLLLISISIQAMSVTIDDGFFKKSGAIIAIMSSEIIFMVFNFITSKSSSGKQAYGIKRELINSTISTIIVTIVSIVLIYLNSNGYFEPTLKKMYEVNYMNFDKSRIVISSFAFFVIFVELSMAISRHKVRKKFEASIIYNHMKERHHLLLIIAFGESILFNITSMSDKLYFYPELFPELILNLMIVMLMWHRYKTFIYKPNYADRRRNPIIYIVMHIVLIGSALISFSILKVYSTAIHERLFHLEMVQNNAIGSGTPFSMSLFEQRESIKQLEYGIYHVYPMIYLIGMMVYFVSITAGLWFAKLDDSRYSKAIKSFSYKFLFGSFVSILIIIAPIILFSFGYYFKFVWILLLIFVILLSRVIWYSFFINKNVIMYSSDVFEAADEIEGLGK